MSFFSASSSIHHNSPLDSLIGQTSRRNYPPSHLETPVRSGETGKLSRDKFPPSPLLHTNFRVSDTTVAPSFIDFRAQDDAEERTSNDQDIPWPRNSYDSLPYQPPSPAYETPGFNHIMDAIGDQSPTLPPSPTSTQTQQTSQGSSKELTRIEGSSEQIHDTWRSSANYVDPFAFRQFESPDKTIPKVVVSSPGQSVYEAVAVETPNQSATRPTPSRTQYSVSNFSRPIRQLTTIEDEKRKRDVIDRNRAHRQAISSRQWQANQDSRNNPQSIHAQNSYDNTMRASSSSSPTYIHNVSPPPIINSQPVRTPPPFDNSVSPTVRSTSPYSRMTSPNPAVVVSGPTSFSPSERDTAMRPVTSFKPSHLEKSINQTSPTLLPPGPSAPAIKLSNPPPSPRPLSKVSLYSTYSYYELGEENRTPSASPSPSELPGTSNAPTGNSRSRSATPTQVTPKQPIAPSEPSPDDYLILGIQHHEANRLKESAVCFQRAATQGGGSGVGMLMWGLALRHAWGTEKDEKAGFTWLRRAAEAAVADLEAARNGKEQVAVKSELVLAIYEVGQCFLHGWGVAQDKKMAVSYFQVAARLGDADAQQELGYCLANGKGCKKDLKEAAKWYRAAVAQGASTVGLAWIYKSKYA